MFPIDEPPIDDEDTQPMMVSAESDLYEEIDSLQDQIMTLEGLLHIQRDMIRDYVKTPSMELFSRLKLLAGIKD